MMASRVVTTKWQGCPKRVVVAHQWTGGPDKDWLPWAKKELEARDFEVVIPAMPDPDRPKIGTWVTAFAKAVGEPRLDDVYVGHSIGCQVILRYLEALPALPRSGKLRLSSHSAFRNYSFTPRARIGRRVNKVICVAPWFRLTATATVTEEDKEIARPWLREPIDFEKVRKHAKEFIAIFSDNDYWVPLEYNRKVMEEKLGAQVMVVSGRGHFSREDGITRLPELLKFF